MSNPCYYYSLWQDRKVKCYNGNHKDYKYYGGRGILMYEPWINDFEAFKQWILTNLGSRPEGLTMDRMDNDKGYEPGNLRWATQQVQADNRRASVQPTNTGEPFISFIANPKKGKPFYRVRHSDGSGGYKGVARSLVEAIELRDDI